MTQPTFRTIPKPAPTLIESIRNIQAQVTDLEASMTELLNQTVKRVVDLETQIVELEECIELPEVRSTLSNASLVSLYGSRAPIVSD